VAPNYIQNASVGYSFVAGPSVIRPEFYVDNVFDRRYLLKGAFFSGASFGRPRTFTVRLNVGV
jgi:outer membrane receptor for Fe3+-dicitrate